MRSNPEGGGGGGVTVCSNKRNEQINKVVTRSRKLTLTGLDSWLDVLHFIDFLIAV